MLELWLIQFLFQSSKISAVVGEFDSMVSVLEDRLLILVTQAERRKLESLRLGVTLEKESGQQIDDLTKNALRDRIKFAQQNLRLAKKIALAHPKRHRLIIARSYYAFYHTARAVVYFSEGGDDFQEHSKVAEKLPGDFPDRENWQNRLKTARLERNKADYEPYPVQERKFAGAAKHTLNSAESFIRNVRRYLKTKGCTV